jgi:hypothetical protein
MMAESLETRLEPGHAHSRGSHVDASALLTQVERHTNNLDLS